MNDDERAIRDVIATWMASTKDGDHRKVLDLMADDVLFLVAGQPPFGKAAFAANASAMAGMRFEAKSNVVEVSVHGDWAWTRTELSIAMTPPSGETVRRSGATLSIFRKNRDGKWVIFRDANLLAKE
jgi:uncharacterized protein (TIGR02246 family)